MPAAPRERQPGETLLFIDRIAVYFGDMPKLDKPKRKPGRPPSDDRMEAVLLKLQPALLAALDQHAADHFESRASVIRKFIVQGLKRAGMKP